MNPVGLTIGLPYSPSRNDNAPAEPSSHARPGRAAETPMAPLPVARARALSAQMEDQLRRSRDPVTREGSADARTRHALQSYTALMNNGQNEMLSELLGLDEYA